MRKNTFLLVLVVLLLVSTMSSVKPGSWLFVSAKACPEYYQCIIREYQREVDYYYECPNCGYSLRNTNIEYKEEHSIVH